MMHAWQLRKNWVNSCAYEYARTSFGVALFFFIISHFLVVSMRLKRMYVYLSQHVCSCFMRKIQDLIDREVSVSSRKDIHLMECIDLFTKQEQLGEEDSW